MTYALIVLAGLSLLAWLGWKLLAWGCEEPDYNAKRKAWFEK
jgi:threonine/homoserine/homoserine lactone efflux protein